MTARSLALRGVLLTMTVAVAAAPAGAASKTRRPDCRSLLPIGKVETAVGGAVTLQHFGKADFILNALTPGTTLGTECVYATTAETQNEFGLAGTVVTAFDEKPADWKKFRSGQKRYPIITGANFKSVSIGGGAQAFTVFTDSPAVYYLYVFTHDHNMLSIDLLDDVTLKTEITLARELASDLDKAAKG